MRKNKIEPKQLKRAGESIDSYRVKISWTVNVSAKLVQGARKFKES